MADADVYFGEAMDVLEGENYRLRRQYLPLGKVGGWPAWLNPKHLPTAQELQCKVCQAPMIFMMQIYATKNDDPPHSFHRSLFFFICRNPECSKQNDASNIAVFRCALPRVNPYYSPDSAIDPDFMGEVDDPYMPEDAPKLCGLCGCYGDKKCSKCGFTWYCSREHQIEHWKAGHKAECTAGQKDPSKLPPNSPMLFPEFAMSMAKCYLPLSFYEGRSDDESDDDDDSDSEQHLADMKQIAEKYGGLGETELDDETEEAKEDPDFKKFSRAIKHDPHQILRYWRNGEPLNATNRAPAPGSPPECPLCKGPRVYELQLMPNLLSVLGVDALGKSIDWATVFVYTCEASCEIPDSGYAREYLFKQDFVE